jgi:sugar phosphate isomerase/epimerase
MPGLVNYRELPATVRAVPLGEGFIDFAAFFAGLKEGGFSGYVAYETCSPLRSGGSMENLDATARKGLKKIKEFIGEC